MRTPIAHPWRGPIESTSGVEFLDLVRPGRLDFRAPDTARFPCLALAQQAAGAWRNRAAPLNAANEMALRRPIELSRIAAVIEGVGI